MVKIIFIFSLLIVGLFAETAKPKQNASLEKCLSCHKKEQIPNRLIYRRYLMKYSTKEATLKAIIKYMKDPQKKNSVMPPPFFIKFGMKKRSDMCAEDLEEGVRAFIEKLDMKKRLVLPQ